jgi:hypothetical protein
VVAVRRQVNVVDPDTRRGLNTNGITGISEYLADLDVANDDVFDIQDADADASESYSKISRVKVTKTEYQQAPLLPRMVVLLPGYTERVRFEALAVTKLRADLDNIGTRERTRENDDLLSVASYSALKGRERRNRGRSTT